MLVYGLLRGYYAATRTTGGRGRAVSVWNALRLTWRAWRERR